MKKTLSITILISIFLIFSGCSNELELETINKTLEDNQKSIYKSSNTSNSQTSKTPQTPKISQEEFNYKLVELKDINTNTNYKISDFENEIVLIESFAIWCPSCTNQQKELKKLHDINPNIISISLDTDQNEDESEVLAHIQKNKFDWKYSISPQDLTSYFISNYGITFVAAPAVPILLKCPNSEPKLLDKKGFKDTNYLIEQIGKC